MFLKEHWPWVLLIFVVLFGANRLPDSARSLARSLRIFRSEVKRSDDGESQDQSNGDTSKS